MCMQLTLTQYWHSVYIIGLQIVMSSYVILCNKLYYIFIAIMKNYNKVILYKKV